ncbi:hypothetical protein TELCIR_18851, partial [Teladorsagia circumcincta]
MILPRGRRRRRRPSLKGMTVGNEVKLVIFDKDGTLVDFHRMWLPWAANTVQLLERATARPVGPAVYKTLGVDPIQGR